MPDLQQSNQEKTSAEKSEMKTALYIRVSTLDQNTELQRRELEAYAARHQWAIVGVYEDKASGADPKRPELQRLLADCRSSRRIECVLVWKLDRFGRSLVNVLENLRALEDEMVRFVSITEGIDTDRKNPAAKLLLHIIAAFAECEREMLRERTLAGLNRYQQDFAAGKVGSSVHSKSGKDLRPGGQRRVVDIEHIGRLRALGLSLAEIGGRLGVSAPTVLRRLKQANFTNGGEKGDIPAPFAKDLG